MSIAPPSALIPAISPFSRPFLIALILFGCGILEAIGVYYTHAWPISPVGFSLWFGCRVIYFTVTGALILLCGRAIRQPLRAPPRGALTTIVLCFILTVLIMQFAVQGFANSGDEFGYNYLADTILKGRVWNPSMPQAALHNVFETYYIGDHDGKRASQYPPGWPALLAVFKLFSIEQFANALIGIVSAAFLWQALRCVKAPDNVRLAVFVLCVAAPFVLFNDASYYNHTLTGACLCAIIWLDLRRYSIWNYFFIGICFSILLTTRYETFLIAGVLFGVDGLVRQRFSFIKPACVAVIGALPFTILLLWYNWRITGNPLQTTLAWASPKITFGLHSTGIDGPHSLTRGLTHTIMWLLSWQDFASVLILPLFILALWRRVITATLRWFDLLLPALVVFFVFYPDYGGFQYGPRYYYFGYFSLAVTIAAGLPSSDGLWHVWRWRFDPIRLSLLQYASFLGFSLAFTSYVYLQTEVREMPFRVAETAPPNSLVLMADAALPYVSWQLEDRLTIFRPMDFTRNGPDGLAGSILLGRVPDDAHEMALVCKTFHDRHVFKLIVSSPPPTGHLEPICGT